MFYHIITMPLDVMQQQQWMAMPLGIMQQQQQWMEQVKEANSKVEAMKKQLSDQSSSFLGIIDEKDNIIATVCILIST